MNMLDDRVKLLAEHILSLKTKGTFRTKLVFSRYQSVSKEALSDLERSLGMPIPNAIKTWLSVAGMGDINDVLAFRSEFFSVVYLEEVGRCLIFAQDDVGCFYAHHESTRRIYFLARSDNFYAVIADDFHSFIEEFELRKFRLDEWKDSMHIHNTGE